MMNLHPDTWAKIRGQTRLIPLLKREAETGCPASMLFTGCAGLGKSALAHCLGAQSSMVVNEVRCFRDWTADTVNKVFLALPVTGYSSDGIPGPQAARSLIVLDEIHTLSGDSEDSLLPILEAKHLSINGKLSWLPEYLTVIGCTDKPHEMSDPLRSRFKLNLQLDPYSDSEIGQIIADKYKELGKSVIADIAGRSQGNPRLALNFADTVSRHKGSLGVFDTLQISPNGCGPLHQRYLSALEQAEGNTLSIRTLSSVLCESPEVLVATVEPHLFRLGLIVVSSRGRSLVMNNLRGKRAEI